MRCVPEQRNARAVRAIVAALLAAGGILYAVPPACRAAGLRTPGWLFTLLCVLSVVAAVFLAVRWLMTGFEYIIRLRRDAEDDAAAVELAELRAGFAARAGLGDFRPDQLDFVVKKSQGSRPGIMECVLGLEDLVFVGTVVRRTRAKDGRGGMSARDVRDRFSQKSGGYVFYDYTLTFLWDEATMLVFRDGGRYVGCLIEADAPMRAYLSSLPLQNGGENGPEG